MKYHVLENGKPAKYSDWDNNIFDTFHDALMYARYWFGDCSHLEPNKPWDFNGYGDTVEIREVE